MENSPGQVRVSERSPGWQAQIGLQPRRRGANLRWFHDFKRQKETELYGTQ